MAVRVLIQSGQSTGSIDFPNGETWTVPAPKSATHDPNVVTVFAEQDDTGSRKALGTVWNPLAIWTIGEVDDAEDEETEEG